MPSAAPFQTAKPSRAMCFTPGSKADEVHEPVFTADTPDVLERYGPTYSNGETTLFFLSAGRYRSELDLSCDQIQLHTGRYRADVALDSDRKVTEETWGPSASFLPSGGQLREQGDDEISSDHVILMIGRGLAEVADGVLPEGLMQEYAWGVSSKRLIELGRELRTALLSGVRHGQDALLLDSLADETVTEMVNTMAKRAGRGGMRWRGGLTGRQLRRVDAFVEAHLDAVISLEDLAGEAGLSRHHFTRQFKVTTGLSAYAYVLESRINHATKNLLQTNKGIAEVAIDCGFTDQPHFTNQFRKRVGITPAEYRRVARYLN